VSRSLRRQSKGGVDPVAEFHERARWSSFTNSWRFLGRHWVGTGHSKQDNCSPSCLLALWSVPPRGSLSLYFGRSHSDLATT
jgi:hypothetical protein